MSRIDAIEQLTQAHLALLTEKYTDEQYYAHCTPPSIELLHYYEGNLAGYRAAISGAIDTAIIRYANLPVITDGRDYGILTGEHAILLAGGPSELVAKWAVHYDGCPDCRSAHFCDDGKNLVVAMGRYLDANPYTIGAMSIDQ